MSKLSENSSEPREFLKYTFFKIDATWRRLPRQERDQGKQEFVSVVDEYGQRTIVKAYSLVGIRGDADFMLWTISKRLEDFQEMTGRMLATRLGGYLTTPYSYLAMTRRSEYLGKHVHPDQETGSLARRPTDAKYLFVYPFTKKREWYKLPFEERERMMMDHFRVGHKYASVKINTGYSFGLDDQEFMLAFETNSPADFLDLVIELRSSEASQYTALETPIFTCIASDIRSILDSVSG